MQKYGPENERVKRDYAFFLQAASGKQDATIDAALRAIERFETSMTTFVGYGEVPGHRQTEILRSLANPAQAKIEGLDIGALEAFAKSARANALASAR